MAENVKRKRNGFVRFFKRVAKFFRDCKGEIKKIVWPTPKATFKNTGVVLVTILVVACLLMLAVKIPGLGIEVSGAPGG